jgi:hypothetical protein
MVYAHTVNPRQFEVKRTEVASITEELVLRGLRQFGTCDNYVYFIILCQVRLKYITIHKNIQRKQLNGSAVMLKGTSANNRYTLQFDPVPTRNDLDYSASPPTKRKLKYSGLGESRMHCSYENTQNII